MGVHFHALLTDSQDKGLTGRRLGAFSHVEFPEVWFLYGVELQFAISEDVYDHYKNLRPRQWSGTESVWIKKGPILGGKWHQHRKSKGNGADDPLAHNIVTGKSAIAYWDAPGINVAPFMDMNPRPSQLYVVQNFTGWIIGDSRTDGTTERLCEVAAWYSIINLGDSNWGEPGAPKWEFVSGTRAGTGWANTDEPPVI
jgi:hypothetical protein